MRLARSKNLQEPYAAKPLSDQRLEKINNSGISFIPTVGQEEVICKKSVEYMTTLLSSFIWWLLIFCNMLFCRRQKR